MNDTCVQIMFENETYKMVRGTMVLMRGVRNGTLYNMMGITVTSGCNSSIIHKGGNE